MSAHVVDPAWLIAWHLGALHPVEKWLTLALAFGPFLLLGGVIALRRRQDARDAIEDGVTRPATGDRPAPPARRP
ncbi:MAG: hypothetical protein QM572_14295 [Nocardioides sp.]|uniref:hypothetical protein n=1 Tax=Nocardioides sp. TaxID=35761 RepID=UPI0039E6BD19